MRVVDVITRVRATVGDVSANQFLDSTIITWINDGIRECAQENMLLQKRATSNTVANTGSYTLPTDILKLYTIVVSGGKIDLYTLAEWQKQNFDPSESGLPVMAYVWAGSYTLWPTPDKVYTVEVDYIFDPADIPAVDDHSSDNTILTLPTTYHSRIVDYCIAQVALQDDNQQLYAIKMEEFATGVKKLADQTQQEEDVYPTIAISPRDMGDGAMDWLEY